MMLIQFSDEQVFIVCARGGRKRWRVRSQADNVINIIGLLPARDIKLTQNVRMKSVKFQYFCLSHHFRARWNVFYFYWIFIHFSARYPSARMDENYTFYLCSDLIHLKQFDYLLFNTTKCAQYNCYICS